MNRNVYRGGSQPIGIANQLKYDIETGCWNFTGYIMPNGYGYVGYKGRREYVHRLAAHLWLRFDLESDLCVLHKCDNRRCFNPKHLFIGTHKDNTQDAITKGRMPYLVPWTHCKRGHELTPENSIPKLGGAKQCRKCLYDSNRRRSRKYSVRCAVCGLDFISTKPTAQTCTGKCRAILNWRKRRGE